MKVIKRNGSTQQFDWDKIEVVLQNAFKAVNKEFTNDIFNDIVDVWLFDYDGEVNLCDATTDEVAQVVWMNREQISDLHEQKMFVGTLEYFFTEVK